MVGTCSAGLCVLAAGCDSHTLERLQYCRSSSSRSRCSGPQPGSEQCCCHPRMPRRWQRQMRRIHIRHCSGEGGDLRGVGSCTALLVSDSARQFLVFRHAAASCCWRDRTMVEKHLNATIRQAKATNAFVFAGCCPISVIVSQLLNAPCAKPDAASINILKTARFFMFGCLLVLVLLPGQLVIRAARCTVRAGTDRREEMFEGEGRNEIHACVALGFCCPSTLA